MAREVDDSALFRLATLLICGLVIAGGFLYAGRLHFAALSYGYETENLRKVREQLAEEQRRFLLEREAALSPARLERAARQLGLQSMQPSQIDSWGNAKALEQKPLVPQNTRAKKQDSRAGSARPTKTDGSNKPI